MCWPSPGRGGCLPLDPVKLRYIFIRIEANEFIEPKHGSGGTVYVDPPLMKELLSFKMQDSEAFVVNSTRGWKPVMYQRYRCEPHWRVLLGWLETNGIPARKKVHESNFLAMPSLSETAFSPAVLNSDTQRFK